MEIAEMDPGQGIGPRLRVAREQRGLSVEECAERLYLPASVLEALENEQFAALGAGVYARGHLRRYAGLLELDAAALEQMMVQRLAAAPDLANIVTRRVGNTNPGRRLGLVPVAIVAVVLALAVLVWWSSRQSTRTPPAPTPIPVSPTSGETAAPPASVPGPAPSAAPAQAPPRAAVSPVVVDEMAAAAATARPAQPPLVVATAATRAAPAAVQGTAPGPQGAAGAPAAKPASAPASGSTPAAAQRRAPPSPAEPAPPRETQSDYTNFDF